MLKASGALDEAKTDAQQGELQERAAEISQARRITAMKQYLRIRHGVVGRSSEVLNTTELLFRRFETKPSSSLGPRWLSRIRPYTRIFPR